MVLICIADNDIVFKQFENKDSQCLCQCLKIFTISRSPAGLHWESNYNGKFVKKYWAQEISHTSQSIPSFDLP